jgi:glycogen operon protein
MARALTAFVTRLMELRRRYAVLRSRNFLHGKDEPAPGVLDIDWFDAKGEIISEQAWNSGEERILAVRRAAAEEDGTIPILNLLLNPTPDAVRFRLAGATAGNAHPDRQCGARSA